MPVATDKGGGSFQLPPAGTHAARCIWIIDLGTHKDAFKGKPKLIRKVRVAWELPNEKAIFDEERGEESFVCGQDYTLSLGERANLRHMLESWRGRDFTEEELKGFDLKILLKKACLVNIIHKKSQQKRDYHQVASVTPLPKGMGCPKPTLDVLLYDIEDGESDTFALLPEWIQDRIRESEEWNGSPGSGDAPPESDEWPEPDENEAPESEIPPPQPPAKPRRRPPEPESHKQAAQPPRRPAPPQPPEPDEDEIPF